MSHDSGHVDKDLEFVKKWFLILTVFDGTIGALLLFLPKGIGSIFLYEIEPLAVQLLGAAYLALGILMFMVRSFNRSAFRLVLDYKILVGVFSLIALIVNLLFSEARWPLVIVVLAVVGITAGCVFLRRKIPREEAADAHASAHH